MVVVVPVQYVIISGETHTKKNNHIKCIKPSLSPHFSTQQSKPHTHTKGRASCKNKIPKKEISNWKKKERNRIPREVPKLSSSSSPSSEKPEQYKRGGGSKVVEVATLHPNKGPRPPQRLNNAGA